MKQYAKIAVLMIMAFSLLVFCGCSKISGKQFSGIRVIFFCGGPRGDSFATVVYNGARAAQQSLGCNVEYIWSDWNPRKMALQFKEAIDSSPDAICMMGHPGSDVLGPLMDEAIRKNIIVTLQNVDLPNIRKLYISKGFGYAGQELYNSGVMLSKGMVRKFHLGQADKALVVGPGITESKEALDERAMRTKGCIDGFAESGLTVYALPLSLEMENNPKEAGVDFFSKAFARYPDVKVLITDHGPVTASIAGTLQKTGKRPGDIIVGGFDLSEDTVKGIQSGYVGMVHDQQPYLQGYLSVLQVCLAKKYGFAGLYIDTGVGLIDNSNIEGVSKLADEQIR